MDILYRIRRWFLFPHTIIVVIWTYSYIMKQAKIELMQNPENHNLSRSELFYKASVMAGADKQYGTEVCEGLNKQMGVLKYILPVVFWYLIIVILC